MERAPDRRRAAGRCTTPGPVRSCACRAPSQQPRPRVPLVGGEPMGVFPKGGLEVAIFSDICFGQKTAPRAYFGMTNGATDAEKHGESKFTAKHVT